ncbi:MAG: YqaJ viral recombinase family protein [Victivallales bacterium]
MNRPVRQCRSGIGGSDIAAVFGLSPWKSRYALYLEKTSAPEPSAPPQPTGTSAPLYWAGKQKRSIADAYIKETKKNLTRSTSMIRDPEKRFFHGHPDYFVSGSLLLLCVSAAFPGDQWGPAPDGMIPPACAMKAQWYMGLLPAVETVDLAVLFSGRDFRIYHIRRDDTLIAHLRRYAELFWLEHVEKRLPPAPLTEEEVREIYPQPVRKTVQATRSMETMIRHYRRLSDIQAQTEKIRRVLRDGLLRGMGDSAVLTDSKGAPLATFRANAAGIRSFRLSTQGEE